MTNSPILNFALDSFRLAHELYFRGGDKLRFSIILLDNCVELSLKEIIRHNNGLVFLKNSDSIKFYEAISEIKNKYKILLPEESNLDILHKSRNNLNHIGGSVSDIEVEFFLDEVYHFLVRMGNDMLQVNMAKEIGDKYSKYFGKQKRKKRVAGTKH